VFGLVQNKCCLYYPDYDNDSELTLNDVDLKVSFVSEKQGDHYTQRLFELTNLLVSDRRRDSLGRRARLS
jgi:hypothetical protein